MVLKCVQTIILSVGGRFSNCNVIDVEKAKVPSLPESNFATFMVGDVPPNKSEFNNSSTA
jgi:hypothetical protein